MANHQLAAPVAAPAPVKPVALPPGKVETPQVIQLVIGKPEKADEGMGGLEFFASAIGSLAWPVAAVIIAAIFHKQIASLLAKIRKLNWGGASVELSEQLDRVEDKSREVPDDPAVDLTLPDVRFQQLIAISPSAAILDSWGTIERLLYQLGKDMNLAPKEMRNPIVIGNNLLHQKRITPAVFEMLRDLRSIRNAAAHQQEVTTTDALRFYELADKAIRALDKIEI
ncbi:DUF4145 domain-containing protein [Sphingomonas fuzhouensis]|uniref:DUF4145 domain-containing protein n=1 Tax=Sphingomonas fuzhouensis TaxID=3106033 RepID=UPI002B002863|nr:DUF4145 domain-containing protein [Sphingomonas sp. SGZ-02]